MRNVFIYSLSDPITLNVKYVGKTFRPKRRFNDHLKCKGNTKKDCWIKNLLKRGLKPVFEIIEESNEIDCDFWEQHWISLFKSWGFDLKNMTAGGDGSYGLKPWNKGMKGVFKHSEESKNKMSKTRKGVFSGVNNPMYGKKRTKESIEDQVKRQLNSKRTNEQKHNISGSLSPNIKPILCFDLNNNLIKTYACGVDTEMDGFDSNMVSKVCRGINKTHRNHIFMFMVKPME